MASTVDCELLLRPIVRMPMVGLDRVTLHKGQSTKYTTSYTLRGGCKAGAALQQRLLDSGSHCFHKGTRRARRVRSTCRQTVPDGPGHLPIGLGTGSLCVREQQRLISSVGHGFEVEGLRREFRFCVM